MRVLIFFAWEPEEFTSFHENWRKELSRGVETNGIPILPDENSFFDICLLTERGKRLFLMFRMLDIYLVAFKREATGRWQEMRPSESDPWLLGDDVDRLDLLSSYFALRHAAHLDGDVTQLKVNKSAFEDSINDILNTNCTRRGLARGLLRVLAMLPESSRLSRMHGFVRPRYFRDYEDEECRGREDEFYGYDPALDRFTNNWKNLSVYVANNLDDDAAPPGLASYELTAEDGMIVTTIRQAKQEFKLLHGRSIRI
ncbi:hypothetical protein OROGR_005223 [Orobanche gracilis]